MCYHGIIRNTWCKTKSFEDRILKFQVFFWFLIIICWLSFFFFLLCSVPVMSWFISPLLSGIMSGILFFLVRAFILRKVIFLSPLLWPLMGHTQWYSDCQHSSRCGWCGLRKLKNSCLIYFLYVAEFSEGNKFSITKNAFRKEKLSTVMCQEIGEAGNEKIRKFIQGGFVTGACRLLLYLNHHMQTNLTYKFGVQ